MADQEWALARILDEMANIKVALSQLLEKVEKIEEKLDEEERN